MQIEYVFFLIYLATCFWLFPKLAFFKNSGLNTLELRILLAGKMATSAGIAFYLSTLPNSDYLSYNNAGLLQYEFLKSSPLSFFTDFGNVNQNAGIQDLFKSSYSFWADIRSSLIYKFIALCNLCSAGNFYLNAVLFSSLVFFGHIAFFRTFGAIYPDKKWLLLAACFLLPSLLIYTSCVHKDGFVFVALAAICYVFQQFLSKPRFPGLGKSVVLVLALILIFMFRNYVLVALLPALFAVLLSRMLPFKRRVVVPVCYAVYLVLFFLSGYLSPALHLPEAVVKRKADFALLEKGNTTMPMNELQPTATSFITNIPQAINHTFLRPYLWESAAPGVQLAAMELLLYQLLFFLMLLQQFKSRERLHDFNVFGILFFISMMLIIGYTIPNIGAIVRYRSIFWVLVITPVLCNINWQKLIGRWGIQQTLS
ncbi:MAG: hypothetical protein EOO03_03910 [Chitinophagaceae bacterium]|nr:MAG: hypothetical protein EOO03_03910 [Chitinophagaceae bacterium]